jgi:ribonuclease-3
MRYNVRHSNRVGIVTILRHIVVSVFNLEQVQHELGLAFNDLSLLQRALTHRSYINEHPDDVIEDNERLEFLGDAVLDFITGEWLYNRFPEMHEGRLTRLRAALVRTETLADIGLQCYLGDVLLLGRGEEDSGGRSRQANLCCAFEAMVGALYLDQGLEAVRAFVLPRFEPALALILAADSDKDPKSRLQEWSQAQLSLTPTYRTVQATGPDHNKEFTVEVVIGDTVYGSGTGHSKQSAAQEAAHAALRQIKDAGDTTV